MDFLASADITHPNGETTHYYEGGSKHGIPLIFIHGWPDIAQIWHHQLRHFSSSSNSKYRVLALDMRGYGNSSAPTSKDAYSLRTLVSELVDFAHQLNIQKAVWIGHDWGVGVVSALAAHHPDLFLGLAALAVPYHTLELGLDHLISLVNRDIYPEDEYPYGQFEYMKYYEQHPEENVQVCEAGPLDRFTKLRYTRHDGSKYGKPGPTSRRLRDGWSFARHPERIPDLPLAHTLLDESLYTNLLASHKKHGFFPPTAYYLNHAANAEYAQTAVNGGVLEFPVLYIDAKHDAVCSPSTAPKMGEGQAAAARHLTYETIEAGHWVQLEKPGDTIAALERWLGKLRGSQSQL